MNREDIVNNFDIDDFVLAILHPNATDDVGESPLQSAPPTGYSGDAACWNQRRVWGDITGDGSLDNFDIDPFADVLLSSHEPVVCYKRFVWDAENRLVAVQPMSTPTENGVERFVYVYDYLGRRVEKRKELWNTSGGGHWATDSTIRLVYDGWNVIEELKATVSGETTTITPVKKSTWGLDLSGLSGNASVAGLHGAGGIGGLLGVYDTNGTTTGENPTADDKSYAYLYDANGNVGQCVEWESGFGGASSDEWHLDRFGARYEYDPYGNIIGPDADHDGDIAEEAGPYAQTNVHRFSTKRQDAETGWIDAGHRLLIPRLGRWGSRDPIEGESGAHVYTAFLNAAVNNFDSHGMQATQPAVPPGPVPNPSTPPTKGRGHDQSCRILVCDHAGLTGHRWIRRTDPTGKSIGSCGNHNAGWLCPDWEDTVKGVPGACRYLTRRESGTLKFGPLAGVECSRAECDAIWACIKSFVPTAPYDVLSYNCRDGANDAAKACCLK